MRRTKSSSVSATVPARGPARAAAGAQARATSCSSGRSGSRQVATRCWPWRATSGRQGQRAADDGACSRSAASAPLVSTVAVIRRVEPASEQPDAVEDPFRDGPMRIVPSLATPISRATNPQVSAYVVVYPDKAIAAVPSLTIEFCAGSTIVGRSSRSWPARSRRAHQIRRVVSDDDLEPGSYRLRAVAAIDSADQRVGRLFHDRFLTMCRRLLPWLVVYSWPFSRRSRRPVGRRATALSHRDRPGHRGRGRRGRSRPARHRPDCRGFRRPRRGCATARRRVLQGDRRPRTRSDPHRAAASLNDTHTRPMLARRPRRPAPSCWSSTTCT